MGRSKKEKPPVREVALRLLARRAHTRVELTRKLLQRAYPRAEIDSTIDRLVELCLMESEEAVASRYAIELSKKKGATPRWANAKMRERGVPSHLIDPAIQEAFEEWDPKEAALRLLGKEENPSRAAGKLQRRGFPTEVIVWVIDRLER